MRVSYVSVERYATAAAVSCAKAGWTRRHGAAMQAAWYATSPWWMSADRLVVHPVWRRWRGRSYPTAARRSR